jgi:hypothetical protein
MIRWGWTSGNESMDQATKVVVDDDVVVEEEEGDDG